MKYLQKIFILLTFKNIYGITDTYAPIAKAYFSKKINNQEIKPDKFIIVKTIAVKKIFPVIIYELIFNNSVFIFLFVTFISFDKKNIHNDIYIGSLRVHLQLLMQSMKIQSFIDIFLVLVQLSSWGFSVVFTLQTLKFALTFFSIQKFFDLDYHKENIKKSLVKFYLRQNLYNYNFKTPIENYTIIEQVVEESIKLTKKIVNVIPLITFQLLPLIFTWNMPYLLLINLGIIMVINIVLIAFYKMNKNNKGMEQYVNLITDNLILNSDIQQNSFGIKVFNNNTLFESRNFALSKEISEKYITLKDGYHNSFGILGGAVNFISTLLNIYLFTCFTESITKSKNHQIFKNSQENIVNILFSFISMSIIIFSGFNKLTDTIINLFFNLATMDNILNQFTVYANKDNKLSNINLSGDIILKNLKDTKNILFINNLEIQHGDIIGLVGSSGSGKTTLLNCLYKRLMVNPNSLLFGLKEKSVKKTISIENISDKELFKNIIILTQESQLFSDTIGFNIYFNKEISLDRLPIILKKYPELWKYVNSIIDDYYRLNQISEEEKLIIKNNLFLKGHHQKLIMDRIVLNRNFKNQIAIQILKELNLYDSFKERAIKIYLEQKKLPENQLNKISNELENNLLLQEEVYAILLNEIKLENRGMNFSGGQRQRMGLAHIIYTLLTNENIRFIFLDEPDTGMDSESSNKFYNLILKLVKEFDLTMIVASHNLNAIEKYCNKILSLDKGKISEYGLTQEILKNDGLFKKLWNNYKHYV